MRCNASLGPCYKRGMIVPDSCWGAERLNEHLTDTDLLTDAMRTIHQGSTPFECSVTNPSSVR
eukprot:2449855-Pleurochrysis_carterae.AAC.1